MCKNLEFFYYDKVWDKAKKEFVLQRVSYIRNGSSNVQAKNVQDFPARVRECAERRENQELIGKRDALLQEVKDFEANRNEVKQ